jgi:opacity protein-like surface antigen
MRRTFKSLILVLYVLIISSINAESSSVFYKELNLIGGYSDTDGWVDKRVMLKNLIGSEYYRKFSGEQGDYLTFDLQARLTYDFSEDFKDAWAVEVHNAWIEYKLGLGKNLRLGHFDPSFGLEPILDTHGKLFQTLAHQNIGFKNDWGMGFRGFLWRYDYEISLQLGSGMDIKRKDGSFLFTQRIGKPQGSNFLYGFSLLYGRVLVSEDIHGSPSDMSMSDKAILKKRIGLDAQYTIRAILLKGELAYGKDDERNVLGTFIEADYTLPFFQALVLQLQGQIWQEKIENNSSTDMTLSLGASYSFTSNFTIRTAYFHNNDQDNQVFIQLYYFGI